MMSLDEHARAVCRMSCWLVGKLDATAFNVDASNPNMFAQRELLKDGLIP